MRHCVKKYGLGAKNSKNNVDKANFWNVSHYLDVSLYIRAFYLTVYLRYFVQCPIQSDNNCKTLGVATEKNIEFIILRVKAITISVRVVGNRKLWAIESRDNGGKPKMIVENWMKRLFICVLVSHWNQNIVVETKHLTKNKNNSVLRIGLTNIAITSIATLGLQNSFQPLI
jgi:hypothetical protein